MFISLRGREREAWAWRWGGRGSDQSPLLVGSLPSVCMSRIGPGWSKEWGTLSVREDRYGHPDLGIMHCDCGYMEFLHVSLKCKQEQVFSLAVKMLIQTSVFCSDDLTPWFYFPANVNIWEAKVMAQGTESMPPLWETRVPGSQLSLDPVPAYANIWGVSVQMADVSVSLILK